MTYELSSLSEGESQAAWFQDRNRTASLRVWSGEEPTLAAEVKRRMAELGSKRVVELGLQPFAELKLDSPLFGYATHCDPRRKRLSDLILRSRNEPWLSWYGHFGLDKRLRAGYELSSLVCQWSTTGYARCEWPLPSLSVFEDGHVAGDDPENFSRSSRARMIARTDPFAIAPELLNGSRQPDALSDAFSLAVVIYGLLRTVHPFGGTGFQSDRGREWVDKPSTRTTDDLVPFDLVFTEGMRRLFSRCFGDGRYSRFARPSAEEWRTVCQEALDCTALCGSCGAAIIIHSSKSKVGCQFCGGALGEVVA